MHLVHGMYVNAGQEAEDRYEEEVEPESSARTYTKRIVICVNDEVQNIDARL